MDVEEVVSFSLCDRGQPRTCMQDGSEQGYTLNELMVLLSVVLVIVGLAVPGILRVRSQAKNEASAIALLRTVASSQAEYAKSCGSGGYAVDFAVLGKPRPDSNTGFIPKELSQNESPRQSGYDFTLDEGAGAVAGPLDCHGIPTRTAYLATARPVTFGMIGTGNRSFAITREKVVWHTRSAAAPDEPFAAPETPLE